VRVIAIFLAAALLFAGCTEDKPKEPDPTSKPTPTATVPPMPAQGQDNSPEGAAVFVSYYIALFNHAAATGDTAPMRALSSNCEGCTKYADSFEATYSRGDNIPGKLWDLRTRNVRVYEDSVDVLTTIRMIEEGKPVEYRVGFVLPVKPPYKVKEIFKGDSK